MYNAAAADAPTPSDSEGDMDSSPDMEPDQDRRARDWGSRTPVWQAEALCTTGTISSFNSHCQIVLQCISENTRRIFENLHGNYAVPPETQPEAIESDELLAPGQSLRYTILQQDITSFRL